VTGWWERTGFESPRPLHRTIISWSLRGSLTLWTETSGKSGTSASRPGAIYISDISHTEGDPPTGLGGSNTVRSSGETGETESDEGTEIMQDESPRLLTLRTKVLVIGGILGVEGRHTVPPFIQLLDADCVEKNCSRASSNFTLHSRRATARAMPRDVSDNPCYSRSSSA
jgi:hypothetical protein